MKTHTYLHIQYTNAQYTYVHVQAYVCTASKHIHIFGFVYTYVRTYTDTHIRTYVLVHSTRNNKVDVRLPNQARNFRHKMVVVVENYIYSKLVRF